MNSIIPAWMNLKQAAAYSGLCQQSIKNLIKLGKVKSSRLEIKGSQRGRRLVNRESLDALIEASVQATLSTVQPRAEIDRIQKGESHE